MTIHFLLVYSYEQQQLIRSSEHDDVHEAMAAYADAEQEFADRSDAFEVLLVGADSIDTVMTTHGHYFSHASDSLFSEFLLDA